MFKNHNCKEHYHHENNDCEIHYEKFRKGMSHPRKEITNRWIDILLDKKDRQKKMKKYILIFYI